MLSGRFSHNFLAFSFSSGEDAFCFLLSVAELFEFLFIWAPLRTEYLFGVVKSTVVGTVLEIRLDLKIRVLCCGS